MASKHEMYSSLTPEMEAQFEVYEAECREKVMTVSESFEYLLAKYEELYNSTNESERKISFKSPNGDILSPTDIMSLWLGNLDPEHSPVNRKTRDMVEMEQRHRANDIKKLDLTTEIDNHSKYLLGQVFSIEKPDEHYAGLKTKAAEEEEATLVIESTYTHPVTGDQRTRYECSICKIKFDTKSLIQTHIAHSDIHAANVKQKAIVDAGRYRAMKQQLKFKASTVGLIMKGFQKYKYNPSTMSLAKFRWKRALNWAICIRWKQIYYERTKKMCFVPNTVHVMYSGNKVFFRRNGTVTVKLSLYLHTECQTVEIVPHILTVATNATDSAEAAGHSTPQEYFIALPRIYLSYTAVMGCMMGNVKGESGLLSHAETEKPNAHGRVPRRSASMDLSMENALATFISNHLKMAKPAKKTKAKGTKSSEASDGDAETPATGGAPVRRRSSAGNVPAVTSPAVSVAGTRKISFSSSGTTLVIPNDIPNAASGLNSAATAAVTSPLSVQVERVMSPPAATNVATAVATAAAAVSSGAGGEASVNMVIKTKKESGRSTAKYRSTSVAATGNNNNSGSESELDNILNHLNEYTITFDDSGVPADSALVVEMPEDLVPIAAVCADQEYNIYEPTENK